MSTSLHVPLTPFRLECGVPLPTLHLKAWTWGPTPVADDRPVPPLPSDAPVVLVIHALTADARVGGPDGWWQALVGPGRALDPGRVRLLCFNNLGSCYGSFGPQDEGFPTRAALPCPVQPPNGATPIPADAPAPITPWDQARAILLGLNALGVEEVDLLIGGSLGGMIAQCLAVLDPERFGHLVLLATDVKATPWVQAFNHLGRQALHRHGDLDLARQVAHLSYRAEAGLEQRQGRRRYSPFGVSHVQSYLQHQGHKLRRRFHPAAYLAQLDAMDLHDLERPLDGPEPHESWRLDGTWGEARLRLPLTALAVDTDQLFRPHHLQDLVTRHRNRGRSGRFVSLTSPHGHDGFLLATDQISPILKTLTSWSLPCPAGV